MPVRPDHKAGRAKEIEMKKIVNLTSHPVILLCGEAEGSVIGFTGVGKAATEGRFSVVAEIPPAGPVARASQKEKVVGSVPVNGMEIPVVRMSYGEPTDLPAPEAETKYFVSVLTVQAAAASGRPVADLLFPGQTVRNREGQIVGLLSFAQL